MPASKRAKPLIALIEDDTFLAGLYVTKLTMEQFEVKLAMDGVEGLKMIQEIKPDLVLLDIRLPKLDGFEVLKQLRASPPLKQLPIILLTNVGTRADVERGLALGANYYIIKAHFLPSEVVAKIKEFLR